MRNPEKDLTLVARSKRKSPRQHKSVEQLVSAYRDMVYTFCSRMIRNPVNAEDLPQEIFPELLLNINEILDEFEMSEFEIDEFKIDEFEGRSVFSSRHYLVACSHCLNFLFSCRLEDAHTDTLNIVIGAATDLSQQDGPA
jgi:Sigma-70 region 2